MSDPRIVWITGAASGQGRRHAERFAAAGARVGCIDVNDAALRRTVDEIRADGGVAEAAVADVSKWDSMARAGRILKEAFGPVDTVIVNAGVVPSRFELVDRVELNDWDRVIAVNLTGAFYTVRAAVPQLRERGGGTIIFVSSVAGLFGIPRYAAYVAAKHGVIGLMRTVANELARDGIRVNAICPGTVDTPILDSEAESRGLDRDSYLREEAAMQLIERTITTDDISDAVMFLTSSAAAMLTGLALPVDGGLFERRVPL